jgi:hypothetical protein
MPKPNAAAAPDPMVGSSSHDPRFSPDAGQEAWIDIPQAPDTLAEMKLLDPECSIGTGNDHAGVTTRAHRQETQGEGY